MLSRRSFLLTPGVLGAAGVAQAYSRAPADAADEGTRLRLVPEPGGIGRSVEVPIANGNFAASGSAFSMYGVTWGGDAPAPHVEIRTRSLGRWSAWTRLTESSHADSIEGRRRGTEARWCGPSDAVEARIQGRVPQLRLVLIDPGRDEDVAAARRRTESEGRAELVAEEEGLRPRILRRARWGADESWRDGDPRYNPRLKQVHVHHTVNSNDYSRSDVPSMIRGMYRYHTRSLGWSDIGYNFLVDRFGRIWEGRYGGMAKMVRGAHTLGFNHQSTGVAVIGNYETEDLDERALWGVVQVAAWKLERSGIDPEQQIRSISQGSDRYPDGTKVRLPAIDGHRDTNDTACPGGHAYHELPQIRQLAARRIRRRQS